MAAPRDGFTKFTLGNWRIILFLGICCQFIRAKENPNIVIILADDLGYGDLEVYGHPTSSTPNINKLAANGMLFTQFYSASPVCSPARAALLTGRYPVRSGVYPLTFLPNCTEGLPDNETTIAELLKSKGYSTNIIGKWHLGVGKNNEHLPTVHHGFDSYFGVPYSHDMCPCSTCFYPNDACWNNCDPTFTNCPVFQNTTLIEQPVDLLSLDERYAQRATDWIADKAKENVPFFLYLSFQHTHHAQYASNQFRNITSRGTFGDSLAAIDWTVGEVINQLVASNVMDNTFLFFTSDNGPSLRNQNRGGSAGLLKCGKGTTYEGGMRVPAIAYWPGHIKPGRTMELATIMDLYPTIANLVGANMPDVAIDGIDMAPILFKGDQSQRESFFYYYVDPKPEYGVYAVRHKQYKAHFFTQGQINSDPENHDQDCRPMDNPTKHDPPLLYDLHQDPGEQYNLNHTQYKDVLNTIVKLKITFDAEMQWLPSQINPRDDSAEPCCNRPCSPFPECCKCEKPSKDHHKWNKYSIKVNSVL